jgi:hypothetical protein
MLIGRFQLFIIMLSTFLIAAIMSNPHEQLELLVVPIQSSAANYTECQQPCSIDYCLKYASMIRNCTRLIRDQCDCCTVCLRTENQICGGHLSVYGLCEQDLLCFKSKNQSESTGICVKGKKKKKKKNRFEYYVNDFLFLACLKFQCLPIIINNKTVCECANRRVPCYANIQENTTNDNCEQESLIQQKRELSLSKGNDGKINLIIYFFFSVH